MRSERPWGAGSPPVEVIVAAALEIVDTDGLAGLTTRRLAAALGTFQPAIYRRVTDRDALLDLVADAVMAEAGVPDADPADWRAWLHECAVRVRGAWRRHPRAAPLMHYGGAHPAIVALLGGVVDVFVQGGFEEDQLAGCLQAYLGYVFGTSLLEGTGQGRPRPSPSEEGPPVLVQLDRLTSADASQDGVFLAGLDIVLDGLASRRRH